MRRLYFLFILICCPALLFAAPKWPAFDPAELAEQSPRIDSEAGAEILMREVIMDDSGDWDTAIDHYLRIKIFSERSLEKFSKIDIFYGKDVTIQNVAARTHRPDGSIVELDRKDVFDREIIKSGDYREKVKSFAPPGLQVGAIVEYRYTRIIDEGAGVLPFSFQDDNPTRSVRLRLKPYEFRGMTARFLFFNCPPQPLETDRDGFYTLEMRDLPAQVDEPWRPPVIQIEPTVLMYYTDIRESDPTKYWRKRAADLFRRSERETKPGRAVKAAVEGLAAPNDSAEEKLGKIHDFCRSRIKHRNLDSSGFSQEERMKFRSNQDPDATLKTGHGNSRDIVALFVAMARAAGFDARYAWCNDRSTILYDSRMAEPFVLSDLVAAVKVGDAWKYCDPAETYLPEGMLKWENSGTGILVAEKKEGAVAMTSADPPEASRRLRTATLSLQADGTLEGDVTISYTGHWEAEMKHAYDAESSKALARMIAESLQSNQPLAEVTNVEVVNASDPLARLQVSYHLRIPEYAERTGSRLFLQPGVFSKGAKALFEASTRKHNVLFRYRYWNEDQLTITLPENFELEAASAPPPIDLGQLGRHTIDIRLNRRTRQLHYNRSLRFNILTVPVDYYREFKTIFDGIHSLDNHVLTLKRGEPPAATPAAVTASGASP